MSNRVTATVTYLADRYAHATDDHGERYFIYPGNFQSTSAEFSYLTLGAKVELLPIQHPKGWRGIEIRILEW